MTFEQWYTDLAQDQIWFEQATMNHRTETVMATARQIWVNGLAEGESFKLIPMRAHRQHLFNKLSKLPPDRPKKKWWVKESDKQDVKPEAPPLVGEERKRWLDKFQAMVDASPMMKPPLPMSARERMNTDVRPLPLDIKEPSELEKRAAYLKHLERIRHSRTLTFLEAYPDAEQEEIEAYLDKFKSIDNPLNL